MKIFFGKVEWENKPAKMNEEQIITRSREEVLEIII